MKRAGLVLILHLIVSTSVAQTVTPDRIFHNGVILTMSESGNPRAEAIAIAADSIVAVGTNAEILPLAAGSTSLVDLAGRTLIPGFVDAHSHLFSEAANQGMTFQDVQGIAFRFGVTAVGNLYTTRDIVEGLEAFRDEGRLKLRTSLFLSRTDYCGEDLGNWYREYPPTRGRDLRLRIGGVKIFADGGTCGGIATTFEYRDGFGNLWRTQNQLNAMVAESDEAGYAVAIHAQGDRAIEQAQNAIAAVLGGGPNTRKHRIEHNNFIREDLLGRYSQIGIVPVIFGSYATCAEVNFGALSRIFGPDNVRWMEDWRALLDANPDLNIGWHSDYPFFVLDPIRHLYSYVTRVELDPNGEPCRPPAWLREHAITAEEALRIMTRGGAYALDWDEHMGSIETGKLADLVVLTDDPTTVNVDRIIDIEIMATYSGGDLVYCPDRSSPVCGLVVSSAEDTPAPARTGFETAFPNPSDGLLTFSYSLAQPSSVEITLFDINGRLIRTERAKSVPAGSHVEMWRLESLSSGVYIMQLTADSQLDSRLIMVH